MWASGPVWNGAENLAPPAVDPRTVQPVGSRYTDYATRLPRPDVTAIIRSLSSETFVLTRAEVGRSLARTNKAFCYSTVNSILSQMKLYNFYPNWMYYITLIIILTICSVVAYRFLGIYSFFSGIVYIPHMIMLVLITEKFTSFIFRP